MAKEQFGNRQDDSLAPGFETSAARVLVRRDRLEASIDVSTPAGSVPDVTREQLLESLKAAGVIYGIDEQIIDILTRVRIVDYVVVARALPPVDGEDGFLKYHVDIESQGRPTLLEDGRVDFKNLNNFINVIAGQVLVEKVPPTPGTPGTDVLGNPIPSKPGKDVSLPAGKNVNVADNLLMAAIDGQLHVAHNRVNVLPIIIIEGDVDYSTGNIDFLGSVVVQGSVQPGFTIKAEGNVEVRGNVCGALVEAMNITVRTGIQGMSRSVLKARDRLVAKFIENATVFADQEIIVNDVIFHSTALAGRRIIVEGQSGLVLGGRLAAGEEIRVRTAGNQAQVATDLEVSVDPFLKEELFKVRGDLIKSAAKAEELKRALAYMEAQGVDNLTADKRERYAQMAAEYSTLPGQIEDLRLRVEDIESLLYSLKPGRIHISNTLHRGVKVTIGPLSRVMADALKYLTLYVEEDTIRFTSFLGNRRETT